MGVRVRPLRPVALATLRMRRSVQKAPPYVHLILLLSVLYVFLSSIEMMGASFKLFGKGFAEQLISSTANPFSGLMVGILATSLVQSSSTVTSLVVGLVGGGALTIDNAVPMIMGANIGTSITNTIVALGHLTRAQEFRRAFAGATVHDFFNLMAVAVFLPLEIATGYLKKSAGAFQELLLGREAVEFKSPLKLIVKPFVEQVEHLLEQISESKTIVAILLLALALVLLLLSLNLIVRLMKRLMLRRAEQVMHRVVFQDALRAMFWGAVLTVLVQSSSVTTSLAVPLLAAGLVQLEQVFPFVLGANVGTTVTGLLAAMVSARPEALTVALTHLFFNVSGIVVFYPLRSLPIRAARWLGERSAESRWWAVGYVLVVFFLIPISMIFITR